MKKKMQKYLSGSNEGFSLVELIIVIAIMAILVGVVALAVIPNLERSRESKDLTTLDNIASALATSVANAGASAAAESTFDITEVTGTPTDAVLKQMVENLGDCANVKLVSSVCKGKAIKCHYKTKGADDSDALVLEVYAGDSKDSVACKYQKDDKGDPRKMTISK